MQTLLPAQARLALPMGEAAQLVALPPEGHVLLAGGMQPSLVHALYPPLDQAAITDRFVNVLARHPARDVPEVEIFFDKVSREIDRYQLIRGRSLLYWQMTGGKSDHPSFDLTKQVMRTIGPRAHQWRGARLDGDIYAYLATNAEFVAWWLTQNKQVNLPAYEYKEALTNQLMFWSAVQRILGQGF